MINTKQSTGISLLDDLNILFQANSQQSPNINNNNQPINLIGNLNLITGVNNTKTFDLNIPNNILANSNINLNNNMITNPLNNNLNTIMILPTLTNNEPIMKEVFRNNEISIYYTVIKVDEKSLNGSFYVSNNCESHLSNVKLNFLVLKHVNLKVLSTSGTSLEPKQSLGIKKVKF
jgi:hypothetical protein